MKIAVLTSSRADYGIYLPLLKAFGREQDIAFSLIVFGTHLSHDHGYTVDEIEKEGFPIEEKIETVISGDSPEKIAQSFGQTCIKFAEFWNRKQKDFDIVFALGDRYEMAAAVVAAVPFQLKFAHLHGGETTLGAIDNVYRHLISLASYLHFVSTKAFELRLRNLLDTPNPLIFKTGSLSLENIDQLQLLDCEEFYTKWKIDLRRPTILVTIHPETVDFNQNVKYKDIVSEALINLAKLYQIVITMPNADTLGGIFREQFLMLSQKEINIFAVENFGTQSYFTCMNYSQLLLGNTSSGILEAASFKKYVVNLGNRQKGRLCGGNVIHVPFDVAKILQIVNNYIGMVWEEGNIYYKAHPSKFIINTLRTRLAKL
jgi:GDP/UDP-N,N'-diacetylbacillosamine 2-epimerase (hydrolysing)